MVAPGGNAVEQTINGQSTWFVSPNDFIDVLVQGSIQVNTASDDDLVVFFFGIKIQLVSWKIQRVLTPNLSFSIGKKELRIIKEILRLKGLHSAK